MPDSAKKEILTEKFASFLASKGCRKTPERFAILNEVLSIEGHFDAETLYKRLLATNYKVVKATVYNNLELLTECGILRKYNFSLHSEYERVDNKVQHIHLICRVCGKVKEAKNVELLRYLNTMKFSAFTTEMYALSVQGVCSTCARKMKKASETKDEPKQKSGGTSEQTKRTKK